MQRKHNKDIVPTAKMLRKNMTKEEKHLWYDFLRTYPIRFSRQKVLGKYIADFYCAEAKLVVELDGSGHYTEEGKQYDEERTAFLEEYGLTVIRIPNTEIHKNFRGVWNSYNRQSVFFEKSCSFFVILLSFLGIMSRTVKLYNELCLCTVKIRNIHSENLLTRKSDRICAQKIIPKVFFFLGHILPQHFCGWHYVLIVLSLHYNPSVTLRVPPPFTQGRLFFTSRKVVA